MFGSGSDRLDRATLICGDNVTSSIRPTACSAILLALSATLALADKGTPEPAGTPPQSTRLEIGAQAITVPKYEGSKQYDVMALPVIRFRPSGSALGSGQPGALGMVDARGIDDVGLALLRFGSFSTGPLLGYRFGRDDSDALHLRGLGDIDGGLVAGAFARYDFGREFVRVSYHQQVTGSDTGYIVRLAAGTRVPVSPGLVLKADLISDIASSDYMSAYFGVTPAQSARSGLRVYDPGAGFKSVGGLLGAELKLDADWTLLATAGYSRLVGDAASSPVVETADRYEARLGLTRAFDWQWR